jgi:membrane-associated phospholipid phosphatase
LLAVVPCGATLNHLLKHAIQRPRPGLEQVVAAVTDFSFPSGHAANATLLYGFVALWLMPRLRPGWARVAVALTVVLAVGLVSCSRVVLGAHRFSDVAAGILLGVAWLALCSAVANRLHAA